MTETHYFKSVQSAAQWLLSEGFEPELDSRLVREFASRQSVKQNWLRCRIDKRRAYADIHNVVPDRIGNYHRDPDGNPLTVKVSVALSKLP